MFRRAERTVVIGIVGALACAVALSGCSGEDTGEISVSLAQTKSPVQLMRNEAASRIPSGAISSTDQVEDLSVACKTEAADPEGRDRSWRSSVLVSIEDGSSWRVSNLGDDLAASFVDEGWALNKGPKSATTNLLLDNPGSAASITLSVTEAPEGSKEGASIRVVATGPCVSTDGADSQEVKQLEKRD
ncbi:MAG: hypothetical protein ACOH1J_03860 [Microbacteriaceae bacterium]